MTRERVWCCEVCDYVHEGTRPPAVCPVCGASAAAFVELDAGSREPEEDA
jgi:nitrite reductase (NADH) large subunit